MIDKWLGVDGIFLFDFIYVDIVFVVVDFVVKVGFDNDGIVVVYFVWNKYIGVFFYIFDWDII